MGKAQPTISTHVLDTARGRPAAGVAVVLLRIEEGAEHVVGGGTTDGDGRIRRLHEGPLVPGDYRIEFRIDSPFFRSFAAWFHVDDASRSYHVPLLMSPYGLATYLGS